METIYYWELQQKGLLNHLAYSEQVFCYLEEQERQASQIISAIEGKNFVYSYCKLREIEEKCSLAYFYLDYRKLIGWDDQTFFQQKPKSYITFFYEQFDCSFKGNRLMLFQGGLENMCLGVWERSLLENLNLLMGQLVIASDGVAVLSEYFEVLCKTMKDALRQLTSSNFNELLPVIVSVDAKFRMFFELIQLGASKGLIAYEEIVEVTETEYKQRQEELYVYGKTWTDSYRMMEKM